MMESQILSGAVLEVSLSASGFFRGARGAALGRGRRRSGLHRPAAPGRGGGGGGGGRGAPRAAGGVPGGARGLGGIGPGVRGASGERGPGAALLEETTMDGSRSLGCRDPFRGGGKGGACGGAAIERVAECGKAAGADVAAALGCVVGGRGPTDAGGEGGGVTGCASAASVGGGLSTGRGAGGVATGCVSGAAINEGSATGRAAAGGVRGGEGVASGQATSSDFTLVNVASVTECIALGSDLRSREERLDAYLGATTCIRGCRSPPAVGPSTAFVCSAGRASPDEEGAFRGRAGVSEGRTGIAVLMTFSSKSAMGFAARSVCRRSRLDEMSWGSAPASEPNMMA